MKIFKKEAEILQRDGHHALYEDVCKANGMNRRKSYREMEARLFPRRRMLLLYSRVAAAAVLVLVGIRYIGHWWWDGSRALANLLPKPPNTAYVKFAFGKQIKLDTLADGAIPERGIRKEGETLSYYGTRIGHLEHGRVIYDTLTTPRSGRYSLVLPDGTRVELNNDSRLIYPALFTGTARTVELRGEAYFDVVRDDQHPFSVKTRDMWARVLGTRFNIIAYPEDTVTHTTLLQGKLAVESRTGKTLLDPGDLNCLTKSGKVTTSRPSDLVDTAWLNGAYYFPSNTSLKTILFQLSRWYNVDLDIQTNELPESRYSGKIDKSTRLGSILDYLHADNPGVQLRLEDNKIIVSR